MPLQKQPIPISFAKGLDTKTDPYQLQMDSFLQMQNSVFTTSGRLTKRNGFTITSTLPTDANTTLTTLNDNLIATGSNLYALNQDTETWLNQGTVQPVTLSTLPLVRVSTGQTNQDAVVAPNGLVCLAYMDSGHAYYQVSDSITGQQVVQRTSLTNSTSQPHVFLLGTYFIVTFIASVAGTPTLQYVAIPYANPTSPTTITNISSQVASNTAPYDAYVGNGYLYIAWDASDVGGAIRATRLSTSLSLNTVTVVETGTAPTVISLTIDASNNNVWITYTSGTTGKTLVRDPSLAIQILAPTTFQTGSTLYNIATTVTNQVNTIIYETYNTYATPYPVANVQTDYLSTVTVTQTGTVGTITIILRSVGLASKPFYTNGMIYIMATYGESNYDLSVPTPDQATYFLIDLEGNIYMRLAYSNGGGYNSVSNLPNVTVIDNVCYFPYLVNDFLSTVNKTTNSTTPLNVIYTQTGVNLATFTINSTGQYSSQIAGSLFLTGGQGWQYDGVKPVEQGFQVWPDNVQAVWSATGGSMAAIPVSGGSNTNAYFYQVTYEWTDNQGNLQRSAPSVPIGVTTTGSGTSGSVTLYLPTLRLTYKENPNPVRIVIYRWSQGQPIYYQVTSITNPIVNDVAADYYAFTDLLSDSQILGNVILYTTGGVVEDIASPPSIGSALFNNRLWLIDAEDQNLLWFSKQVIESTTVEMSDLLTIYVAPTTGAQGSTGPMTALFPMDDKLIVFKKDAIYYINGIGPDNTGANSTYSDPIFITGTIGCSNPNSIVLMPSGLMFQSDKGIWLLGRDLSTSYVGAPVEIYNTQIIESATAIPGTTQVRFLLANNTTLMYDYFFGQWGTFTNMQAVSATLWKGYHTYLNSYGQILQETPGIYVDGSTPVLLSLTSAWINLAGLQGLERFYFANLLGTYITPFKLNVQFAYNYNSSPSQATIVTPDNYSGNWGSQAVWGSGPPWGGSEGNVFTARIFPQIQKCQSFQLSIQEVYDPSFNVAAGAGLTLSGMNIIVGVKKGFRTQSAGKSFG